MSKKEIDNLKESSCYKKIEAAALKVGITPEQALEFIDAYIKKPIGINLSVNYEHEECSIKKELSNAHKYKVIDISKICKELLDVLAKNEVPVAALGNIFNELDKCAKQKAIIQNKQ